MSRTQQCLLSDTPATWWYPPSRQDPFKTSSIHPSLVLCPCFGPPLVCFAEINKPHAPSVSQTRCVLPRKHALWSNTVQGRQNREQEENGNQWFILVNRNLHHPGWTDCPKERSVAYTNHHHPYNVTFTTPPEQFDANYDTLNAIFHTFKEKL